MLTRKCERCNLGCEGCTSKSICTGCIRGRYLQVSSNSIDIECKTGCPDRFYPDEDKRICVTCKIPGCTRCQNQNTCTQCEKGKYLAVDDNGVTTCVSICPITTVRSASDGKCVKRCQICERLPEGSDTCQECTSRMCRVIQNCRRRSFCPVLFDVKCDD